MDTRHRPVGALHFTASYLSAMHPNASHKFSGAFWTVCASLTCRVVPLISPFNALQTIRSSSKSLQLVQATRCLSSVSRTAPTAEQAIWFCGRSKATLMASLETGYCANNLWGLAVGLSPNQSWHNRVMNHQLLMKDQRCATHGSTALFKENSTNSAAVLGTTAPVLKRWLIERDATNVFISIRRKPQCSLFGWQDPLNPALTNSATIAWDLWRKTSSVVLKPTESICVHVVPTPETWSLYTVPLRIYFNV